MQLIFLAQPDFSASYGLANLWLSSWLIFGLKQKLVLINTQYWNIRRFVYARKHFYGMRI